MKTLKNMKTLTYFGLALILGLALTACDIYINDIHTGKPDTENNENEGSWNGNNGETDNDDETDHPESDQPESGGNKEFVILFTNDFHSQIDPMNNDRGGAARLKALVDSVGNAEPVVLLADAGDLVQGTYYFSLFNGVVEMKMLNELGYDIRTLGNHEFDKKMVGLGEMLALSSVPVVATNYDFSKTSLAHFIKDSAILDAGNTKVGFIGLNVRLLDLVDPTACEGVVWQDAINVADTEAEKLRNQGADIVIALSHLGYGGGTEKFYYDTGIIPRTRHIDMIIGGHSHTTLYDARYIPDLDEDLVPIVQTGSKGANLGYAKIKIDTDGKPSFDYKLIPVNSRLDDRIDESFAGMLEGYAATAQEKMNEKLGYCPYSLYKGNPESPLGNLTADGLIWMAKKYHDVEADVSIYNSGGIRSSIYEGDVTLEDIYAVYPFDNALTILTMKGSDLNTLFNYVASYGGMPINSAVRLVLDQDRNIKSLTINGQAIQDNKTYTIATIDYLANTGEYGLDKYLTRKDSPEFIRDYFGEYFRHLSEVNDGRITASTDGRVRYE